MDSPPDHTSAKESSDQALLSLESLIGFGAHHMEAEHEGVLTQHIQGEYAGLLDEVKSNENLHRLMAENLGSEEAIRQMIDAGGGKVWIVYCKGGGSLDRSAFVEKAVQAINKDNEHQTNPKFRALQMDSVLKEGLGIRRLQEDEAIIIVGKPRDFEGAVAAGLASAAEQQGLIDADEKKPLSDWCFSIMKDTFGVPDHTATSKNARNSGQER